MKMIVFATINTNNPDGYQILTCKEEDTSWMVHKTDIKLAEVDVPVEEGAFKHWLGREGMDAIDKQRQKVVDSYTDAMNTLAERETKYLMLENK